MQQTLIQVYEHDSLTTHNGLDEKQLELLSRYVGVKAGEDFPYYSLIHNGIKFKHYVGVLCVGDLQIEVLPKADKYSEEGDKDIWEQHLLEMLRTVYRLEVKLPSKAYQKTKRSRILEIFLSKFLDEVEHLLHQGLVKAYRRVESNSTALKGRLMLQEHITKNSVHKERFFVNYTTYDYNHILNRIIHKTLTTILNIPASSYTHNRAKSLLFEFPELNNVVITDDMFANLSYDRKTEGYREAIELARIILLSYVPNFSYKKGNSVLAMMFDMNKLWEQYVFAILRRELRGSGYCVYAQKGREFWKSKDVGNKIIRPDIVVVKDGKCLAVLDTKWKIPKDRKPSDGDLKQMYVYHQYWDTNNTALIYPGMGQKIEGQYVKGGGQCGMFYLPIGRSEKSQFLDATALTDYIKGL